MKFGIIEAMIPQFNHTVDTLIVSGALILSATIIGLIIRKQLKDIVFQLFNIQYALNYLNTFFSEESTIKKEEKKYGILD